jgi:hypothetical protein
MEILGSGRRSFSLTRRPLRLYTTTFRADRGEVDLFEPYEENLPLEAGFYSFVLDERGNFRVRRGNTSSHASFSKCRPVGGAGHFRINRAGNVAEVFCISLDYRIYVADENHPTVSYLIDAFCNHHALEISPLAVFRFKSGQYESFYVSIERRRIEDLSDRLDRLEREGQGQEETLEFSAEEVRAFDDYSPEPPRRLYPIHRDQLIISLESDKDEEVFEVGPSKPRYSPKDRRLTSGKKAFVIDPQGWLIIGSGHHLISGGGEVGAAGQIVVEPSGVVSEINLNFSGHYRPPLDGDYARDTYRALAMHPLMSLSPDCVITGRIFDEANVTSTSFRFSQEELNSDDPTLDEEIERASL